MSQTQLIQAAKSAPKIYLGSNVTVARVHTSAVVKYGREVRLPEARTMQHVADRSTVRLPRVILACEEEDDDPDDSKNRLHLDVRLENRSPDLSDNCTIRSWTLRDYKHGHAKVSIEAYDIFTHKKYEDISPAHANVDVPIVVRREYLLLYVDGGYLSLFNNDSGETKDDVKLPEGEVGEKIMKLFGRGRGGKDIFVVIMGAMGKEMAMECKEVERA